ncbi:30S ribosome-binding factor RbfA [Dokdonella sp.]|uniref:30S ribosome-binding factor RbfA n=1 Tax=Dokdonella sp. TaxID=2291710 RepID=UPI003C5CDE7E
MSRQNRKSRAPLGPSQRQLRAGELIRHALVEVMREEEIHDPALAGVSITVTEVRLSADLKHANCFVEPLGAGLTDAGDVDAVVKALNTHAKFLRGALSRHVDMKFTPDLRFRHDESFEAASHMDKLLANPHVRRDLDPQDDA